VTPAVRARWADTFEQIELAVRGDAQWPALRHCATCWYVAGIAYEAHDRPLLTDSAYDRLSAYLLQHLGAAHVWGADMLECDELRAGTAMNWRRYLPPFHAIAADLCAR
jgi:hypothetical protein